MTKIVETDSNGNILATNTFVFDANERLTSKAYGAVGHTYRPVYEKNSNGYIYPDNEILGITLDGKTRKKKIHKTIFLRKDIPTQASLLSSEAILNLGGFLFIVDHL